MTNDTHTVFNQHEYDKWTSYQQVKKDIAKRKMIEAQENTKKEMLKALEGEDIAHIDVNSAEGTVRNSIGSVVEHTI